jgi:hypothetical protein
MGRIQRLRTYESIFQTTPDLPKLRDQGERHLNQPRISMLAITRTPIRSVLTSVPVYGDLKATRYFEYPASEVSVVG